MKLIINIFFNVLNRFVFFANSASMPKKCKFRGVIFLHSKGRLVIGENLNLNSGRLFNPIGGDTICRFIVQKEGSLVIGNNVGISNSTFFASSSITIGDNVRIGGGCKIWDTDHHSIFQSQRLNVPEIKPAGLAVVIRDNVWLGADVTVLKGVEIGAGSVVAAGSVVTKNISNDELWGGNPAKFIKFLR